jgi:acyl carrier protein
MSEVIIESSDISEWIIEKISELTDVKEVKSETEISSLRINSVTLVGLLADVEDNFGIEIEDPSIIYQKKRISDLVDFLVETANGK